MKYIVYQKLIYGLEVGTYLQLSKLELEYETAKKRAEKTGDQYEYEDEPNNLNNFLNWVVQNIKPVSGERDNFDLHRYDRHCYKVHIGECEDLPF